MTELPPRFIGGFWGRKKQNRRRPPFTLESLRGFRKTLYKKSTRDPFKRGEQKFRPRYSPRSNFESMEGGKRTGQKVPELANERSVGGRSWTGHSSTSMGISATTKKDFPSGCCKHLSSNKGKGNSTVFSRIEGGGGNRQGGKNGDQVKEKGGLRCSKITPCGKTLLSPGKKSSILAVHGGLLPSGGGQVSFLTGNSVKGYYKTDPHGGGKGKA